MTQNVSQITRSTICALVTQVHGYVIADRLFPHTVGKNTSGKYHPAGRTRIESMSVNKMGPTARKENIT
jgi:hypothetical protein